ncbi:MAG TPA: tRNA (adenosine(37)-N6)-threonylcarbamoyltransferase complex transferase subunit TsaD [Candidatus Hydrogenedentes bacterium]|nr:tRNA (adenosine(37)-N6)-threonylcarbamoyltransferase complex transferase subunit TsaD [Candidatus Hydrogenedentota bacterium]
MSVLLGIETSCDETGVAVVKDGFQVLSNEVASQIDVHREFGGVVPEIASRQHTRIISQLVRKAMADAGVAIDAIAATRGPGLMGSLLVGLSFGKALAFAWNKPFLGIHHIEGHIFSAMFCETPPVFPFLALVVSGGHTQLVQCPAPHVYQILGSTRDDAIGESFDKVARLLGLPYPGGPSIQKAAEQGNPAAYRFPRGMLGDESLDFSYSGLKTAVLYAIREAKDPLRVEDLAASFQAAAVDALLIKTKQAIQQTGAERLVLAGGVAANRLLRQRLSNELAIPVFLPPFAYCVDNGAMIAAAADSRLHHGLVDTLRATPDPSVALG